ncbi:MFS transporter [Actinomadura sp. DSM 109109]|nr:MFS transporter [Actinomadura lepetitiana]
MFSALRHYNYRLALVGQSISTVGTTMQLTAQDWLVLDLTHDSGSAVGVTVGLQVLPLALFGLYGSVLADRYPKRPILLVSQTAMGTLALVLGLLTVTGSISLWHIYVLAFGLGLVVALNNPTWMAFNRELVGTDDLPNAVGLNSAAFNLAKIVGPAAAGVLIAGVGTGPVFLINAASFGVMVVVLCLMREKELFSSTPVPRAKGQVREGLRYVRGHRDLAVVLTVLMLVSTFGMNFAVTNALMSREVFHTGASSFGLVTAMLAVGGVVGALLTARRRQPSERGLLTAATAFSVLVIASGLMPTFAAYAAMQLPTGVAMVAFAAMASALTQLNAPKEMAGRVMGLYLLVVSGGSAIIYPLIGWLAENFGARSTLIISGLASLVSVAAAAAFMAPVTAGLRGRGTAQRS